MINLYLALIENHENDSKFKQIHDKYHDMMYNVAYAITKNYHDAEEAMQEALFTVAEEIEKIDDENVFMLKSFLCKITKNSSIDILRQKKRSNIVLNIDEIIDISSDEDINSIVEGDEQYKQIVKHIAGMPSIYRDVLSLHFLKHMSTSKIARVLKRAHSTVKSQLNRGTKILREILREAGFHD